MFDELDQTIDKIKQDKPEKTEIRILILGVREYISKLMFEYQKMYPNVHFVAMFDANSDDSLDYDLIIDKDSTMYREYKRRELGNYEICFKAVPDHPLVGKELTMRDLRNENFITLEYELGLNSTLFECCKIADFYPNIVLQTNDRQCFRRAAKEGIGIGLWLNSNLAPAPKNLVDLDVKDLDIRYTIYLYYKNLSANEHLKNFFDFIMQKEF